MSQMKKDPKSPATTMDQYDDMLPSWTKIQTVLDGTESMRAAAHNYLPQHPGEDDVAYQERLERNTLNNLTKLTLNSWVGRPFSDPIKLKEDVPTEITDLSENIDTIGSHLNVFTRNWFKEGVAKSFAHVMVDMPRLSQPEGRERSHADDLNEGVRPYWILIQPEDLFFAEAQIINGVETLLEVRFQETITHREGFVLHNDFQIRRLVLIEEGVGVEIWQKVKAKNNKKVWTLMDSWIMEIDEIPIITFYSDRSSFMLGVSPLEDLTDLNIAHWQSTSDQRAILTVARFPILAVSGGTDESNQIILSPHKWLFCPDPQGRFYYVEHSGKAIGEGRQDLHDLERQMGEYGAEFLKKRPDRETATARLLDSAEATSALQDVVLRFQDAVENALALTAKWLNIEEGGSIDINSDFSDEGPGGNEVLRTLLEARKNGDITQETFLKMLVHYKVLEEDFDVDTELLMSEEEALRFSAGMNTDPEPPPTEPKPDGNE